MSGHTMMAFTMMGYRKPQRQILAMSHASAARSAGSQNSPSSRYFTMDRIENRRPMGTASAMAAPVSMPDARAMGMAMAPAAPESAGMLPPGVMMPR